MKIAFRADASLQIGTGHVMRCLTLARALTQQGHECCFLTRVHEGNLISFVRDEGFEAYALPAPERGPALPDSRLAHADWLGVPQELDAAQSAAILRDWQPDWLVVDHYALDHVWETLTAPFRGRLLVIDDLADRRHACDALLDQTLDRLPVDYRDLVPEDCRTFTGPRYALLRPEFAELRPQSLMRRESSGLSRILISMGGVDQQNATAAVLDALRGSKLANQCRIDVVLGPTAPWLEHVRALAAAMPWPTQVLAGVRDMANRMANCDLAIGAAGSTSWERCCLGVPTIMVVLAGNQRPSAAALSSHGAAVLLGEPGDIPSRLPQALAGVMDASTLGEMGRRAAGICDGLGATRVLDYMEAVR